MEQYLADSYMERGRNQNLSHGKGHQTHEALEMLNDDSIERTTFSPESWKAFETSVIALGFEKKDAEAYLASASRFHGQEILVRRASMRRFFDALETGDQLSISALDSEPNASLLGSDASGVESALSSGFGWVVDNKVAGVFGFMNKYSQLSVQVPIGSSPSLQKKSGELMRRVSGNVAKDDVLFMLFRIHKSAFPESLLEESDMDEMGDVHPFIIRVYAKHRQAH